MAGGTTGDDPYAVLGVARDADAAAIKSAYRALAKKLHPDLHPGDAKGEARFKAVTAAYDLLGDAERRRRFDAGEIDGQGAERPARSFYRDHAASDAGQRYQRGGGEDFEDILARAFGPRGGGSAFRFPGADRHYRLEIGFLEAVNGAARRVTTPEGATLDITIPAGVRDGQTLRLAGRGAPGGEGGPPGDVLVEVSVAPHAVFTRDGGDIRIELPTGFDEAILGASVEVPTPAGPVRLRIPPGSASGRVLRVKGRGVPGQGDLLVTLRLTLPETIDETLQAAIRAWRADHAHDPRAGWKGRLP